MPPSLALFLWLVLLGTLLYFDPAKTPGTSPALWVPVIWMFILATRLPSQWLGGNVGQVAAALEEGNPLDRSISSALILLAIGILISRSFKWGVFCGRNVALLALLLFALVSFVWSDSPFIALKRWVRDLGNYMVVLVAVSDRRPLEATRTLLRRLCYLLIPLSILMIKYYPQISRQYDYWSGLFSDAGPATSKNMLGVACLISGLFFCWDTMAHWSDRKTPRTKRIIIVNTALFAMTLWVLHAANSATSRLCLLFGCLVIAGTHTKTFRRHPTFFKVLIPTGFCLYMILAVGFDLNGQIAAALGRDPTLTDRTKIWAILLGMHTNPLLGTGYESFWLGPRLMQVWHSGLGPLNEAHNGYLQVYLNLGLLGLLFLGGFLTAAYRAIWKLDVHSGIGPLALAVWTVLVFYNITEAAFLGGLLWLTLLLGVLAPTGRSESRTRRVAVSEWGSPQIPQTLGADPTIR